LELDRVTTLGAIQCALQVVTGIDVDDGSWRGRFRHRTGDGRDRQLRWAIVIAGGSGALDEQAYRHNRNYQNIDH
jgi:hypothetical protein